MSFAFQGARDNRQADCRNSRPSIAFFGVSQPIDKLRDFFTKPFKQFLDGRIRILDGVV